jgi:hypothetical protein
MPQWLLVHTRSPLPYPLLQPTAWSPPTWVQALGE